MKNDYTHITVVLDKSGSMGSTIEDTIGGFNTFLRDQLAQPGTATMSLCQFDTYATGAEYEFINLREVKERDHSNYIPGGSTALLDAIGMMIDRTGEHLRRMPEEKRPGKIIFLIITDGEENASREYCGEVGRTRIFEKISHQRDKYNWEFTFMGCNQDAVKAATSIGIQAGNSLNYVGTGRGTRKAWHMASASMSSYRGGLESTTTSFFNKADDQQDAS